VPPTILWHGFDSLYQFSEMNLPQHFWDWVEYGRTML
jgi:hypothetical protein